NTNVDPKTTGELNIWHNKDDIVAIMKQPTVTAPNQSIEIRPSAVQSMMNGLLLFTDRDSTNLYILDIPSNGDVDTTKRTPTILANFGTGIEVDDISNSYVRSIAVN